MKKVFALVAALMLLCIAVLADEAAVETTPEIVNPLEDHDFLHQAAVNAEGLITLAANSPCRDGFEVAPDSLTASYVMGRYAETQGYEDGQVLSQAQMELLYADLFADGEFTAIEEATLFEMGEEGYRLIMADGDFTRVVMHNDCYLVEGNEFVCDVSVYAVGHDDFPMIFEGSALVGLIYDETAPYGARLSSWTMLDMPLFDQAQSNARLGDQAGNTYYAENAIDGNFSTCWAYRVSQSEEPSLTLSAAEPQQIRGVVFTPGYAKNETAFSNNRRVAQLMVTLDDGSCFMVDLPDVDKQDYDGTYVLSFGGVYTAQSVTIEVTDSYKGGKYDDVCISEIYLF